MTDGGKGSAPRPIPDWDTFSKNFDTIFGKTNVSESKDTQDVAGKKESGNGRPDSQAALDK